MGPPSRKPGCAAFLLHIWCKQISLGFRSLLTLCSGKMWLIRLIKKRTSGLINCEKRVLTLKAPIRPDQNHSHKILFVAKEKHNETHLKQLLRRRYMFQPVVTVCRRRNDWRLTEWSISQPPDDVTSWKVKYIVYSDPDICTVWSDMCWRCVQSHRAGQENTRIPAPSASR